MIQISRELLIRIKLNERPAYEIAHDAGIGPTILSRLMNGIDPIKESDQRVIRVGRVLGLEPEECFQDSGSGSKQSERRGEQ